MPRSTSSTSRASPTATATGSATWPGSGRGCRTWPPSASTRSGTARGTRPRGALAAPPGSAERDRFWFRPGRGDGGDLQPNSWRSIFGGPAWTRTISPDGTPGEWYLHLFAPEQPDFNWANPEVRAEFEDILRFWFDRGVDGIRIDSAALLTK